MTWEAIGQLSLHVCCSLALTLELPVCAVCPGCVFGGASGADQQLLFGKSSFPRSQLCSREGKHVKKSGLVSEYQILSAAANCSPAQSSLNTEVVTGCLNSRLWCWFHSVALVLFLSVFLLSCLCPQYESLLVTQRLWQNRASHCWPEGGCLASGSPLSMRSKPPSCLTGQVGPFGLG